MILSHQGETGLLYYNAKTFLFSDFFLPTCPLGAAVTLNEGADIKNYSEEVFWSFDKEEIMTDNVILSHLLLVNTTASGA